MDLSPSAQHPLPSDSESLGTASQFEGELISDGTALLHESSQPVAEVECTKEKTRSRTSSSSSSEGYDGLKIDPSTVIEGGQGGGIEPGEASLLPARRHSAVARQIAPHISHIEGPRIPLSDVKRPEFWRRRSIPIKLEKTNEKGRYLLTADDQELREVLQASIEHEADGKPKRKRLRFRDVIFTRQFTAFDRQNASSAASTFRGFYTLFWLGTAMMMIRLMANNWRDTGSIFGTNELVHFMFHRDVVVLLATDGVMCAETGFCLLLQMAIRKGYMRWNTSGWIIQSAWQVFFLGSVIEWTLLREWPWSHTVYLLLHSIVMLMKQHSYAFYNGHLSEVYRRRAILERKLAEIEEVDNESLPSALTPSVTAFASSYLQAKDKETHQIHHRRHHSTPAGNGNGNCNNNSNSNEDIDSALQSAASVIDPSAPLDGVQIHALRRLLRWEIDSLSSELAGKSTNSQNAYPKNLSWRDFYGYIPLPTVVYELEYPRAEDINWSYVIEKLAAIFGVIGIMIAVSQAYIYPIVKFTITMRENNMPIADRLREFPWILLDLIFPFMLEYLLSWYVIWELILNVLAEVTRFADRGFYADWWNSVSWDAFSRDWNRPVHCFLLRHVYHSSISAFHISRSHATLITFFISACMHEVVMWCIFKRLRGYLLFLQMTQLPLVALSKSKWLKGKDILGNAVFWLGILTGPSLLCSLYLVI